VQAGKDAFPNDSGRIRNALVYGLDGRFDRIVSVKADKGKGEYRDTSGSGSVGETEIVGKCMEAVTHWKLLGSSVRSSALHRYPHTSRVRVDTSFPSHTDESTDLTSEPRPRNRIKTPTSNSLVEGSQW